MKQTEEHYSSVSSASVPGSARSPLEEVRPKDQRGGITLLPFVRDLPDSRAIALAALLFRAHGSIIRVHFVCPYDAIALPFR